MRYEGHRDQRFGCESYSQHGEDIFLLNLFDLLEMPNFKWLDIGAHHPTDISNTALMYKRGNRGTNIEANPALIQRFLDERPEDNNLCFGVAKEDGEKIFYKVDETSGLNSFCSGELSRIGVPPVSTTTIKCIGINNVIDYYLSSQWPELLLVDAEGMDYEILNAASFDTNMPEVICAEVRPFDRDGFNMMLYDKGYFCLTRITANLIYVRLEHWYKVR
jgi:FkbM family methyltransferase